MRILLTNDDGIYAPGLCALYDMLSEEHEVIVVAPESERSAVGHAITVVDPLRAYKIRRGSCEFGWAISGTPADCVKLAIYELVKNPVDMVISGINPGANVGVNALYSGTVSAATEAAILGLRSMAVSLNQHRNPDFCFTAGITRELIPWLTSSPIPHGVAMSVNVPSIPPNEIKGIKMTRQGTTNLREEFDRRSDPRGNIYYWRAGDPIAFEEASGCDSWFLSQGYITITPIRCDLTAYDVLGELTAPPL